MATVIFMLPKRKEGRRGRRGGEEREGEGREGERKEGKKKNLRDQAGK